MATTNHKYDPADCAFSLNGVPVTDWGPGDFFSSTQTNNDATSSADVLGNGKMAVSHDKSGTITLTMDPYSAVYQQVIGLAGTLQEVPLSLTTPVEHVHSEHAVMQKISDISYGTGFPTRSVVFECPDYQVDQPA